jgi:AraC-like DNA-binding protein
MVAKSGEFHFECIDGYVDATPIWESHCHIDFEMIYVVEGDISVVLEGRRFRCQTGQTVILPPLTYHSVRANQKGKYSRVTALFSEGSIPYQIREEVISALDQNPVVDNEEFSGIAELLSHTDDDKYLPLAQSAMIRIFYTIAERSDTDLEHGKQDKREQRDMDSKLAEIISYIDDRICEKITLDDVADGLFISKSTLCHLFSKKMKISVKQYIVQKKIALAAMKISDGMSATDAAAYVGYDNYSNFYRMYKKHFDITPSSTRGE